MGIGKQGIGPRLLRAQDLPNVRMRDAMLASVRTLKARPEPRWQWDNLAANRATPWRPLVRMLSAAIAAGAPLDDVLVPVRELEGQLRALFAARSGEPADDRELMLAIVAEARADAAADVAQAEAAVVPSRPALERLIETTERQESAAQRLCATARRILGRPLSATAWRGARA